MQFYRNAVSVVACSIILTVLYAGCGMFEVESIWRDRDVAVDGVETGDEWKDAKYFLEDNNMTLGLVNDEKYLYIRISSSDRAIHRQILGQGLTIWMNDGSKDKTYGIKYPAGMMGGMSSGQMRQKPTESPSAQEYDETMASMLEKAMSTMTIIGPAENTSITVPNSEAETMDILAQIGYSKGSMVYELRVPLCRDEQSPYGICADAVDAVGIGFESEAPSRPQGSAGKSRGGGMGGMSGGRSGGMGGMGGGRGGGMGGRSGGGGMSRPSMGEPLELWMKVKLTHQ